ncbi:unnamed protein product, partial [Porites lobata]
ETFPHAIVYIFEALLPVIKSLQATKDLLFKNEHLPVSVLLADTLNREPEHIISKDREELVRKFWEALVRRALISQWCFQTPVTGFNLGCCDLNLIKKYFVTCLAPEGDVKVVNKQNKSVLSFEEYEDCQRLFGENGDEEVFRLAGTLQQRGCRALSGLPGVHASLL